MPPVVVPYVEFRGVIQMLEVEVADRRREAETVGGAQTGKKVKTLMRIKLRTRRPPTT